jgi:uncharacterized damage-inducible protein DinB
VSQQMNRLFTYDAWANREVLKSFHAAARVPPKAVQVFAHVLSAGRLWYQRIQGLPQTFPVWPDLTLEQCQSQATEVANLWGDFFRVLPPDALSRIVNYKNTQGQAWTSSVGDILQHVIIHSEHHRGQIAAEMRAAGNIPALTDFIHAARSGLVE